MPSPIKVFKKCIEKNPELKRNWEILQKNEGKSYRAKGKSQSIQVKALVEKIQEKKLVSKIDFESIWDKAKEHSYDLKIADFIENYLTTLINEESI